MRALLGSNAAAAMRTLTPYHPGWAAYYRTQVSSEVFSALDVYMWKLLYRWANRTHPKKSRRWRVDRSLRPVQPSPNNRWGLPAQVRRTKIVRHVMVTGAASPDDRRLVRGHSGRLWTSSQRQGVQNSAIGAAVAD